MELRKHVGVCGFYKLVASRVVDGERVERLVADWFPNLITNGGLDMMGSNSGWYTHCHVGSYNTTPQFTDSGLGYFIAYAVVSASAHGTNSGSPWYHWQRRTYRFAKGVATGNLSEVGVGQTSTTGNLFSRALILDSGGDPTTITILADETLDVIYEWRLYPKETDTTGTVVFTGNIGGSYDYTLRSARLGVAQTSGYWNMLVSYSNVSGGASCYNGVIGAITGIPTGTGGIAPSIVANTYVNGSYERSYTISFTLAQGNISGGIRSVMFCAGQIVQQIQFDPAIPKTADNILSFVIKISWGRV